MIKFYAFRINLIKPAQSDIFSVVKPKEAYFYDVLDTVVERKKSVFHSRKTKYIIFFDKELLEGVTSFELAKEEIQKAPIEGADKIERVSIITTPFVYFIVDRKRQIILIQEKTTVFQEIDSSRARIEEFLTIQLRPYLITAYVKPITDKNEFWEDVEKVDGVKELDITFNAPNMFRGRHKAEELVEEVYEDFNITEFTVKLKNKLGQLKLMRENLAGFISLVSAGAGKYTLRAIKNGRDFTLKSYQFIKNKFYDVEVPGEIEVIQLEQDLIEFDKSEDEENRKVS